ncbi:hypothetical protein AAG570_012496 [Ranatra chinensis]|uniref:CCHC-type domain-containing protein n=1 Tax=Ranatra chinensis TaxID=642074 RepID=A0ABD0YE18_9HEMI
MFTNSMVEEILPYELLEELKTQGFPVTRVAQQKATADERKLPIFLVKLTTSYDHSQFKHITDLCGMKIKTTDRIREEDEEFQEEKKSGEGWATVVMRRSSREHWRQESRTWGKPTERPHQKKWEPREDYKPRVRKPYKENGTETRHCYQCWERGHLARNCPYVRRPSGHRDRTEPMEVNLMDLVKVYDNRKKGTSIGGRIVRRVMETVRQRRHQRMGQLGQEIPRGNRRTRRRTQTR